MTTSQYTHSVSRGYYRSRKSWRDRTGLVVILLCGQLAKSEPLPAAPPDNAPTALNIVVVEGEGAVNNVRKRVAREPIVRVEDQNHRPLTGAAVTFVMPGNGAGGSFGNGASSLTVMTDAKGQAIAHGLRANSVVGKFQIHVTASAGKVSASLAIPQTNAIVASAAVVAPVAVSGKLVAVLVAVGAAAASGAAVAVTRGKSSPVVPPAPSISPGTGSVGAPH